MFVRARRRIDLASLMAPALYLGRAQRWLEAFDQHLGLATVTQPERQSSASIRLTAGRSLCLAQVGRMVEAQTLVTPLLDNIERMDDELPIGAVALLLQAAIVLEHRAATEALAERLACVAHLNGDSLVQGCVARYLGDAATLVGDRTAARNYYAQALEIAVKIRCRPELALTHLRLAELLLEQADDMARSEALANLDLAIPELRDMKMRPALERALAIRDTYQGRPVQMSGRSASSDGLTAREREIAGLIARGLSNREIGERLVITEGTVEVHVKHILSKLGVRCRSQVVSWHDRQHDKPSAEDRT